jgi:penicillin-binding protein 1A
MSSTERSGAVTGPAHVHGDGGPRGPGRRALAVLVRVVLLVAVVAATGLLLGVLVVPVALFTNNVLVAVRSDVLDVPPIGDADTPPQNSYVYAADGSELAELTFEENRVPVRLSQVPQVAIDAVLATEDADFYAHQGVDHAAILRAAWTNFRVGGIESGASTITQQYVKQTFLTPEQTLERKIQEALYAIQLERELPKDEILERYLNRSYFGNGVYGIGTAADRYFSKEVGELTLSEAATLAGVIRSPERNNPIASVENAQARRDIVLRQMANHGFITPAQAQAAIDEPLVPDISEPTPPDNPFWVEWVSRLLVNEDVARGLGSQTHALDTMGATFEERRRTVFQSGLRIHTTLDLEFQALAEEALRQHLSVEDATPEQLAQEPMGAIVSVDPETGAIVAMALGPQEYGSCSEDDSWVGVDEQGRLLCDRTKLNPAVPVAGSTIGRRQPGSAYKPILTAAALEEGVPPTFTLDARGPQEIEGCTDDPSGGLWTVRNTGGDAILDMYGAVQRSSNVYHALLVAEIGPDKLRDMGYRLGIRSSHLDGYCAAALGSESVTPLEMASAYATLANRGTYCAPFAITRIEDAAGRVLWEYSPDCQRVIDTEVADRTVDILAGPVSGGGTAPVANLAPWPTRGKTGTTNDYIDAWFVGFVKQLSTAAWIGYPNGRIHFATLEQAQAVCGEDIEVPSCIETRYLTNTTIAGNSYARVFGGTIPAPMWKTYMAQAVERYEPEDFPAPGPLPTAIVPNLLDETSISRADRLAQEAGFRLAVQEVEHWLPEGTIVGQEPEPGSKLALGSRIILHVSDGEGDPPLVPDVVGMHLDEAREILIEAGYRVSTGGVGVGSDESLDWIVLEQDPAAGEELEPGSRVFLLYGRTYTDEGDDNGGDDNGGGNPGQGRGPPGQSDDD